MKLVRAVFVVILLNFIGLLPQAGAGDLFRDAKAPLEDRVEDLFKRLTPEEKLSLLNGTGFGIHPIERLGIGEIMMVDASQGVRGGDRRMNGPATQFSSGPTMASTWDPELVGRIGKAIGEEAANKGIGAQILLGPGVNIHRSPLCGRNGEYFSEDPYLASRLAVDYIRGLQSTGVAACIKHFACNNEEDDRDYVDVIVSERALREIYLPAFEAGVKEGGVWTLMSSYNRVNGHHMSANEYLLAGILKKEWGFDGLVMSDWGGVHQLSAVYNSGNDLEMPGQMNTVSLLLEDLKAGKLKPSAVDDSVRRILRTWIRVGAVDAPRKPDARRLNTPEHQKLTYEVASKGIVLLKNKGDLLPLNETGIQSVTVIGRAADHIQIGPAGSPSVTPFYKIQPLEGIRTRAGSQINVLYASGEPEGLTVPTSSFTTGTDPAQPGLRAEYFSNRTFAGKPAYVGVDTVIDFQWSEQRPAWPNGPSTAFSVRWTGKIAVARSGTYRFLLGADDRCSLYIDNKALISHNLHTEDWITQFDPGVNVAQIDLAGGKSYDIQIDYVQSDKNHPWVRLQWATPEQKDIYASAIEAARKADVAVVCVSTQPTEREARDRKSMRLPFDQDTLIRKVVAANPRTVVVLNNGGAVDASEWIDSVPVLLEAWFPGQEGGRALAGILFGDINPSGKLPDTLGKRREDYPDFNHFPGTNRIVEYVEGIYVGYRHFDKKNIEPLFPFGFGLSYTTFRYSNLRLSQASVNSNESVQASFDITNTGKRAGGEIAQLYVSDLSPKVDKPLRELKGFARVELQPGETKTVTLTISPRALAYCDVPGKQWKADAGRYEIQIGASSRDIRLKAPLTLAGTFIQPLPGLSEQKSVNVRKEKDLALRRPVSVSSVQESFVGENAVDGNRATRWGSAFSDPQWLAVDLGKPTPVRRVRIAWENAFARSYAIEISDDGENWKSVYSMSAGSGGEEEIELTPVTTRWVRLFCTKRSTKYGYSLYSFEVF
jgi:beta-glucosidase